MTFDTAAARARCEKATPGPWVMIDEGVGRLTYYGDGSPLGYYGPQRITGRTTRADSEFIAAARTDLPAALDRIDELEREIAKRDSGQWVKDVSTPDNKRALKVAADCLRGSHVERIAELERQRDKALAVHESHWENGTEYCQHDDCYWPCPTVQALTDTEASDDHW